MSETIEKLTFRALREDEIDCRVAQGRQNGVQLLLYKDARVDMNILDETVGADRWQRTHEIVNGNLFCNVSIRFTGDDGVAYWVTKQDVGTESNTEAEKGQASDSFKRACVNWGIGRELYTSPFVWIAADKCNLVENKNRSGSFTTYDRFHVEKIVIEGGRINAVAIWNDTTNKRVYTWQR